MHREIGWYLVELERMLRGRVRDERLSDLLAETEAHLKDLADGLASEGHASPGRAAVERFGSVVGLAKRVLNAGQPSWITRWLPALATVLLCITPAVMLHDWGVGAHFRVLFLFGLWPLVVVGVCSGIARRVLFGPLMAGAAAGCAALLGYTIVAWVDLGEPDGFMLMSRSELISDLPHWRERAAARPTLLKELQLAKRFYGGPESEAIALFYAAGVPDSIQAFRTLQEGSAAFAKDGLFRVPARLGPKDVSFTYSAWDTYAMARARYQIQAESGVNSTMLNQVWGDDLVLASVETALRRTWLEQARCFWYTAWTWSGFSWIVLTLASALGAMFGHLSLLRRKLPTGQAL